MSERSDDYEVGKMSKANADAYADFLKTFFDRVTQLMQAGETIAEALHASDPDNEDFLLLTFQWNDAYNIVFDMQQNAPLPPILEPFGPSHLTRRTKKVSSRQ